MENYRKEQIKFHTLSAVSVTDVDAPGTYHSHWHDAAEFTVALKDGCIYKVNDETYHLSAGDILLAWPQQLHETITIPSNGAMFTQFTSGIIENNLDLVAISRFLYDCKYISAKENPELASMIAEKIYEIKEYQKSTDFLVASKCKKCIYEILIGIGEYVMNNIRDYSAIENASGSGWDYVYKACTYMAENAADDISQSDVADYVGLSTFYFSKLFKQYMNISFPAYLSNLRVQNAAKLLSDKTISITDCAFLAGFQSTTAFNKAFHEITGYSPREYRKLYSLLGSS